MRPQYAPRPALSWMAWGMLKACPRRWLYRNEWKRFEHPFRGQLLAQRNLMYATAWAGQLADDAIIYAIRHFKKTGAWPEEIQDWIYKRGGEYARFARKYRDAANEGTDLPNENLLVHMGYFYGEEPTLEQRKLVLAKAVGAIEAFFASDIPGLIEAVPREALECRDEDPYPWFLFEDIAVYCVYDFAIRSESGVTIFDWKTGKLSKESAESALMQLHWYALYAIREWEIEPEDIELAPVFLSAGSEYDREKPNLGKLDEIADQWRTTHADLKDRTSSRFTPVQLEERFPMTDNLRECQNCQFRACEGYRWYLEASTKLKS